MSSLHAVYSGALRVLLQDNCTAAVPIGAELLAEGNTHGIQATQVRGYFAAQHQSPRKEGTPLACRVAVGVPIRLAGRVLSWVGTHSAALGRAAPFFSATKREVR